MNVSIPNRITYKDSTSDTFIEQVHFTDSSGKARRKRIVYRYANEQSDRLLARPLSDTARQTFNPPVQ
jgi:hypothetical protein